MQVQQCQSLGSRGSYPSLAQNSLGQLPPARNMLTAGRKAAVGQSKEIENGQVHFAALGRREWEIEDERSTENPFTA